MLPAEKDEIPLIFKNFTSSLTKVVLPFVPVTPITLPV